ncbi:LysR family transcriptional regulator [Streptomyces sp. NPDC014733]|uniref:LysR family transcriptional regulator n=1 Tax=Streptomyces sp. NPDC014733 TaxID=3364885 RepID=UPI0036FA71E7
MELRHLRYFLAVAELGTVTAAAARFHIAQPAISRQLRRLEHDLGVTLFARSGPRLALTEAGRAMLEVARDIVTRADQAGMFAQHMANGYLTRLTVGAASTSIDYVLAPFVAELGERDPFVTVDLVAPDAVHEAVRSRYDLGISAMPPPADTLVWRHLTAVPLRAYVGRDDAWAGRSSVRLDELLDRFLILPPRADPTRMVFDEALTVAGQSVTRHDAVASPPLRLALAASGRGVAIATDLVRFDAHPLFVHDREGRQIQLAIHACWNREHYAAAAIGEFVDRFAVFAETRIRAAAELISTPG